MDPIKSYNRKQGRLRVFTWNIHGTYLYYLSMADIDIYIPFRSADEEGYGGRGNTFPYGENVIEVPYEEVRFLEVDLIIFQSRKNYLWDQFGTLSEEQRALPKIYLEHDPPRESPTSTFHVVKDPDVLVVHVTHFNQLMWAHQDVLTCVIDHGVPQFSARYSGKLEKGIVVINNPDRRGRRLGWDIFQQMRKRIPLDIIGMGTESYGLGEINHKDLPGFIADYRFFFTPIRYTSLGLSILEAMSIGVPVVGMATTELVNVIENEQSGFIHTDLDYLEEKMNFLLSHPEYAKVMGQNGAEVIQRRFNMDRFTKDWEALLSSVAVQRSARRAIS